MDKKDCYVNILDKFLQIYNMKYDKSGSLFENIDLKDPLSTNDKLELFYEYMEEYSDLQSENINYIDVYSPSVTIPNDDNHDIYALIIGKNRKIKYISLSFISLLYAGIQELGMSNNWSIIALQ